MNRVNPIHIIILLFVLLAFFLFKLNELKGELVDTKVIYGETVALSSNLKGLQQVYGEKNRIKKSLNRVLRQSSLLSANLKKKVTSSSVIISTESMNQRALNSLMSKILNGSYNITLLKIKRLSDKKVSLKMEIKW